MEMRYGNEIWKLSALTSPMDRRSPLDQIYPNSAVSPCTASFAMLALRYTATDARFLRKIDSGSCCQSGFFAWKTAACSCVSGGMIALPGPWNRRYVLDVEADVHGRLRLAGFGTPLVRACHFSM